MIKNKNSYILKLSVVENKKLIITKQGLDDLVAELEERKIKDRDSIANDIDLARQQGDLSENAAYKAAMEAKEFNENRIEELESMIKNAEVTISNPSNMFIEIGEEIILENLKSGAKIKYRLVGASEADPAEKKISIESPIGKAIIGKRYGDKVTITLPSGEAEFKIQKP